ncbi:transketolase [Alkalicoccus luteus]|uniref:Transketolase n=1 Tax=Alkalicoccus luteus TaxID=1237094 RepID=A0A969PMZ7_9BACI|nr:transketolase [Alkalicoccus luteus]NJP36268.1 transketolase [Alkalicoccus luteus]
MTTSVDQLSINTIRTLSIDSIEKANSGHPGMPMGSAPMAYKLFTEFMQHNPANPDWFNRDRFILSAGHGSMLLYSLLHLHGYDVTLDDLKNFRQFNSRTPGHPEYKHTPGVEATTGPLGQGIAMATGFAMAEAHLSAVYNKPGYDLIDHYTYSICGDGDLMEGVSAESASLAGHLKLGKLIVLYDSNDISLDGDLHQSFSESVADRYRAYGWHVLYVEDGNDLGAITKAVEEAKADDRPSMIEVKTVIGYGSPNKSGKSASHGAPLGEEEAAAAKKAYNWEYEEPFYIPDEVKAHYNQLKEKGQQQEDAWNDLFASYKEEFPELGAQLERAIHNELPEDWDADIPVYEDGDKSATRASGGEVLNAIAGRVPNLFGGSADLASSNKTMLNGEEDFSRNNYAGRNIWFGVREFAMAAAVNGMALHGGVKPYGATFFVFSDYLRPAVRLAALMKIPSTFVFTHDSIAVGEDGPTHEPVEQLPSLRAMPGLSLIRPADGNETAAAWRLAVESKDHPTALVLTRQGLPVLPGSKDAALEGVKKGAYVISEANGRPDGLLLASGSEVSLAVDAQSALEKEGIFVSVVSVPSWDRFDKQSDAYKESVLPSDVKARLAIEVASPLGWERYTGSEGSVLGIETFGASAPGDQIMKEYGFHTENVVNRFKQLLNK